MSDRNKTHARILQARDKYYTQLAPYVDLAIERAEEAAQLMHDAIADMEAWEQAFEPFTYSATKRREQVRLQRAKDSATDEWNRQHMQTPPHISLSTEVYTHLYAHLYTQVASAIRGPAGWLCPALAANMDMNMNTSTTLSDQDAQTTTTTTTTVTNKTLKREG